ncbi:MAG: hypothetical protein ACI9WV_000351, partial [Patiriisocius sp.]
KKTKNLIVLRSYTMLLVCMQRRLKNFAEKRVLQVVKIEN